MDVQTTTNNPVDHMSARGASELAKRIERYWQERGGKVRCHLTTAANKGHGTIYVVRSNMIGGVPCHG